MVEDTEPKVAKKKEKKKLMAGLQIIHSGPFIPGNTTHNWTGISTEGKASISHHQLFILLGLFPAGLQDKSFLLKLQLKWEKSSCPQSDSFQQNMCRGLLVTESTIVGTRLAEMLPKVNNATLQNARNNSKLNIPYIFPSATADFSEQIKR